MARPNADDPDPHARVALAAKRKWSARAWWLGLHLYNYGALVYASVSDSVELSALDVAILSVVAVVSVSSYVALQTSSPGYVERTSGGSPDDLETGVAVDKQEGRPLVACADGAGSDMQVDGHEARDSRRPALRYCNACHLMQPLRAKHCKDCDRCVRQYDHHCDCAGTCVGEHNRRRFVLYLVLQSVEAAIMLSYLSSAISLQSNVDEWFKVNAVFLIGCTTLFFAALIAMPLFGYQMFLIATNQTSWEHARRRSITYLRDLPDDHSPFDRGTVRNCGVFLLGGDSNKWVHRTSDVARQ